MTATADLTGTRLRVPVNCFRKEVLEALGSESIRKNVL